MFDENKYRACFDELRAPESMEREILKMTTEKNNKKHFSVRAALVIAAVLVLLLGLGAVAYAAGWFNVEDAVIGSLEMSNNAIPAAVTADEEAAPVDTGIDDFLCLQGVKGSPEYEATKEWFDYYWSDEYEVVSNEETLWNSLYNGYGAFSQKSFDKLDEICAKYGLELNGSASFDESFDVEAFCAELGCGGLLKESAGHSYFGGYRYDCGSFKLEGEVSLPEGFDKPISYQLMNYQKGYLANGGYVNIGEWEDYEQWDYVTAEGVTVTIVHSADRDIVLVNLANSVVAINVVDFGEHEAGRTRADMEAFANCFDFTAIK